MKLTTKYLKAMGFRKGRKSVVKGKTYQYYNHKEHPLKHLTIQTVDGRFFLMSDRKREISTLESLASNLVSHGMLMGDIDKQNEIDERNKKFTQ